MYKIAFFCIPAHGHTNPTLAVVERLVAQGDEVWYYSYDALRAKIEATGARYISCDPYDIQMKLGLEDVKRLVTDVAFSAEVIVNTTLAMDEAIYAQMKAWKPDCIVADSMAFWGKLVARKLGVPFVSSTTTFAFNRYSSKLIDRGKTGLIKTLLSMLKANRTVKRLRDKGYPVKNVLSIIANDDKTDTIVYTSRGFQPYADTFSAHYTFVGPSIPALEGEVARAARRSVYISLGTVLNDQGGFYRRCVEALRDRDIDVIMSVGDVVDMKALGEIPKHFTVEKRVNQIEVLRKADAFITHCGMNSVNEALYMAVPLILFPQTPEQGAVARRVAQLGAGLYLKEESAQAIVQAVGAVLDNPGYREAAKAVAADFQACGGAKLAADRIHAVARGTAAR